MTDEKVQNTGIHNPLTEGSIFGTAEMFLIKDIFRAISEHMGLDLILFNHDLKILYHTPRT